MDDDSIKLTDRRQCVCNWKDCKDIQQKLRTLLPADDVYNKTRFYGYNVVISSHRTLAMRATVARLLKVPKSEWHKGFNVAPHHFNRKMLEKYSQRAFPLTYEQAKEVDERLAVETNKIQNLLPKERIEQIRATSKKGDIDKYVQAPCVPRAEVLEYIHLLENPELLERRNRRERRLASSQGVSPSPSNPEDGPQVPEKDLAAPSILPARSRVVKDLQSRYLYCLRHREDDAQDAFLSDDTVAKSLRYLKFIAGEYRSDDDGNDPIPLPGKKFLFLCDTIGCGGTMIKALRPGSARTCDRCTKSLRIIHRREARRKRRREEELAGASSAGSNQNRRPPPQASERPDDDDDDDDDGNDDDEEDEDEDDVDVQPSLGAQNPLADSGGGPPEEGKDDAEELAGASAVGFYSSPPAPAAQGAAPADGGVPLLLQQQAVQPSHDAHYELAGASAAGFYQNLHAVAEPADDDDAQREPPSS